MTLVRQPEDPKPFPLTLQDYRVLHEAGAFDQGPRVELIEGMILQMNPQQNRHSFAKSELGFRLSAKLKELGSPLRAIVEPTIAIPPDSAPEPDIALTSDRPRDDYVALNTVALLIEVSSTTLKHDLERKAELYAASGVPEYWVLEVYAGVLHRHWEPEGRRYRQKDVVAVGGVIESITIAGLSVESDGLI
jgi:Uma2 family endonuclease